MEVPLNLNMCPDEGFILDKKRKKRETNDPNPEHFWSVLEEVNLICKKKFDENSWGAKKIKEQLSLQMSETSVRKYLANFLYDDDTCALYHRSTFCTKIGDNHRRVLSKEEMIAEINVNHKIDHRKSDAVYETLRKSYFPVVRENTRLLFKQHIKCSTCLAAVDLPKTQITRRPIPATYSNSRWQMDLKKMPPCKGYNYICNIVDCYSRFAFGGHLKQKTAKEVSELLLKFIYIFGPPRILQTDNGKEFNNADLCAVIDEFKTRKINGRPYHPQSQGRVERFNRTVVAYFRAQFVDTRDWPSLLGEFYYKYNNRVNKSTRPMTPHQRFFKRPNFSMALEEQVAKCKLTKEEKEFLEMAHLDVEEDDDDNNNLALNENLKSVKINEITGAEQSNINQKDNEIQQSEIIHHTIPTDSATIGASNTNFEINSKSVINKALENKAQEIARMDAENDYQEFVESMWHTKLTNRIKESELVISANETITSNEHAMQPVNGVENVEVNNIVQTYDRLNEIIPSQHQLQMSQPLQDITNSQMMRNTSLHQSEVSPYYKDLYSRRFIQRTDSGIAGLKRRHLETEIYMSQNREEWDSSMYPEELFPKKVSKLTEMQTFHPAVNEIIDFKPNSALSAGTNVFLSGYWKKGLVINIENDDSKGKVYTIKELENGKVHQVSKYLIRPNLI
ncbi:uncharacterized protein [Mytilus edulis]|uniref:uncharacterized protein n=1 Tax=Mytilus edulis TaxID=6550 RepID=UPI0039EE71F2